MNCEYKSTATINLSITEQVLEVSQLGGRQGIVWLSGKVCMIKALPNRTAGQRNRTLSSELEQCFTPVTNDFVCI